MDQNIPPAAAPAAKPIDQNILMQLIAYLRNKVPAPPPPAPGAMGPGMPGGAETALRGRAAFNQAPPPPAPGAMGPGMMGGAESALRGRKAQMDAAINQASQ